MTSPIDAGSTEMTKPIFSQESFDEEIEAQLKEAINDLEDGSSSTLDESSTFDGPSVIDSSEETEEEQDQITDPAAGRVILFPKKTTRMLPGMESETKQLGRRSSVIFVTSIETSGEEASDSSTSDDSSSKDSTSDSSNSGSEDEGKLSSSEKISLAPLAVTDPEPVTRAEASHVPRPTVSFGGVVSDRGHQGRPDTRKRGSLETEGDSSFNEGKRCRHR